MRIAILTGGTSGERDISIRSAQQVQKLRACAASELFVFPEDTEAFMKHSKEFACAIPMIHGAGGEDGTIQELLESLALPYIFSKPQAHAIGIDKRKSKFVAHALGIRVPREIDHTNLEFPLFVKPNLGGSSIASKLCNSVDELENLVKENQSIDFLLEEPIRGREFSVGVIEHDGKTIPLPVTEIIPRGAFFDFKNKYESGAMAQEMCPADIPADLCRDLQSAALRVHERIGARHLSRSDFIVTSEGALYFLEINTIPGMTETSLIPAMLAVAHIPIDKLFEEWIAAANVP